MVNTTKVIENEVKDTLAGKGKSEIYGAALNIVAQPAEITRVVKEVLNKNLEVLVKKFGNKINAAEAKKFIDWLYTSEQGKKTVIEDFKFIPAYNGYDADKIADPLSKEVYDYSSKGNTTGWVFMGYPTDWGMNVLGAGIQKYVSDEATWDELMKEVKTSWDDSRK